MSIGEFDVDALLCEAVPEFASVVREHREEWPDTGMLYALVPRLFDAVVEAGRRDDADARSLLCRAYALTERMLVEGTPSVRDCFSIEMIEPLWEDHDHEVYPNVEFALGPVALADLRSKIECGRRYAAMSDAIARANRRVSRNVCLLAGVRVDDTARVIVDRTVWNDMDQSARAEVFALLRSAWMELQGRFDDGASGLELTDTVENGFAVVIDDSAGD